MPKYEINKFINIIENEMAQYSEINEEDILNWKTNFLNLIKKKEISKKNIKKDGNKTIFIIDDEMEIFSIVDDFLIAKEENDFKTYWNSFK